MEKQLGADHPDVAQSLNNLAALYDAQGKYAEAEPLFRRSLSIREKQLGADHPNVADSYFCQGAMFYKQGKYKKSKEYLENGLNIYQHVLGNEHPKTKNIQGWLDRVQQAMLEK